ncbi:hypothetical protein B0F90DRAFT_1620715 [Multifurca ochricompacta]|uniref:Uncharacterized protein n=1 Tax=Multifurca ochricompacta TaxID=376703 RepID=A0AAD4QQ03_9AGAM|nr:hypothetical protein B0F90DRAFT_1620715 [Multifurca ochricompacta]
MQLIALLSLALATSTFAFPQPRASNQDLKNGQTAIATNEKFSKLTANSPCKSGETACVNGGFAQCVSGKFQSVGCAPSTVCAAVPVIGGSGVTVSCLTPADRDRRIAATGANSANGSPSVFQSSPPAKNNAGKGGAAGNNKNNNTNTNNNPQTSLTLDPKVIATGFKNNGQGTPVKGQVASLTSSNNFINFCKTIAGKPITNGKQTKTGSCNPAPLGVIAATTNMPSSKFVNPPNFGAVKANTAFDIKMSIRHIQAGNFVNAQENYYSAPQTVNSAGDIVGHTHFVVQKVDSFTSTKPLDPNVFAFFKGVNTPADKDGNVAVTLTSGLPEGTYRLASINTSANHTPVLVAVAQHGSLDDQIYVSGSLCLAHSLISNLTLPLACRLVFRHCRWKASRKWKGWKGWKG